MKAHYLALLCGATILCSAGLAKKERAPLRLSPGPHLFLDDRLIEKSSDLKRQVWQPRRDLEKPVVTGKEDRNFQPYVTVLRDAKTGRFRMWYNVPKGGASASQFGYLESADGVRWDQPHRVLARPAPIQFGASVVDEGPGHVPARQRFKAGWWHGGGLCVASSADGLDWQPLGAGVVLRHNHDINCIFRDPARGRYVAMVSSYTTGKGWKGKRRITLESTSDDLVRWRKAWPVIMPDEKDEGETQFYCMGGFLRGPLLVGMLKVLRDDLPADVGGKVAGLGYTVLAWSHDGEHWQRERVPFLDRHPTKGVWDHAMAWGDCQLLVGDEVFLYYGGYARGHKINRFAERQIGLVRFKRDRYIARIAGEKEGKLRTPPLVLDGKRLTINADARGGRVRVQITDVDGKPLPGFAFADGWPITTDELAVSPGWKQPISALRGKSVRLEVAVQRAKVFAFDLHP